MEARFFSQRAYNDRGYQSPAEFIAEGLKSLPSSSGHPLKHYPGPGMTPPGRAIVPFASPIPPQPPSGIPFPPRSLPPPSLLSPPGYPEPIPLQPGKWRAEERGHPIRGDQLSENIPRAEERGLPPPPPPIRRAGDIDYDQIVDVVVALVVAQNGGRVNPHGLKNIARINCMAAGMAVEQLELKSGRVWSTKELTEAFKAELLKHVQKAIIMQDDSDGLAHKVLANDFGVAWPVGGGNVYNPITNKIESGAYNPTTNHYYSFDPGDTISYTTHYLRAGGGFGSGPTGIVTIINISSKDRNSLVGTSPNTMVISLSSPNVVNLGYIIKRLSMVELLEMKVHRSSTLSASPNGTKFYVAVDEIPTTVVRQSDGKASVAHFMLSAQPQPRFAPTKVQILTNCVKLITPVNLPGVLTIRVLDVLKKPLSLEPDAFGIVSITWDDVNQRTLFALNQPGVRNADYVIVNGVSCSEDLGLFSDSLELKAVMLSPMVMALYRWRAAPRTLTYSGAVVICLNNVIDLTLKFTHGY
jgi:hypothetical protein